MTTFSTALRHYRTHAGWSLNRLGVEAGVYHQAIMRYERGERHPTRETVEALVGALGLSPLDADKLRLAAGFAPCDLVGLICDACADIILTHPSTDTPHAYAVRALDTLCLLDDTLQGQQGRTLDALCRQVAP